MWPIKGQVIGVALQEWLSCIISVWFSLANEWIGHVVGFLFMGEVVFDGPKPISGGHIGVNI